MARLFLPVSALAIAAISIALVATASAATKTVTGTVGPGFTISLKQSGKKVTTLKPGTYRFTISDKSSIHDFHLTGPGVNKVITGVGFTGTRSIVVSLKKGTYRFVCDPHASFMRGSVRVA
jgi:plastocyanin